MKMANQYDICCVSEKSNKTCKKPVVDVYDIGFKAIQTDVRKGSKKMNRLRPSTNLHEETIDETEEMVESNQEGVFYDED